MARPIAVVLIVLVSLAPVHAQSLRESIRHAAEEAAAQQTPQTPTSSMSPAYKWTGIGLLGGGGLLMVTAAILGRDDCTTSSGPGFTQTVCLKTDTTFGWVLGGIVAGAGGAVLAIGSAKGRGSAPSISLGVHDIVIRQPVPISPKRLIRLMHRR